MVLRMCAVQIGQRLLHRASSPQPRPTTHTQASQRHHTIVAAPAQPIHRTAPHRSASASTVTATSHARSTRSVSASRHTTAAAAASSRAPSKASGLMKLDQLRGRPWVSSTRARSRAGDAHAPLTSRDLRTFLRALQKA